MINRHLNLEAHLGLDLTLLVYLQPLPQGFIGFKEVDLKVEVKVFTSSARMCFFVAELSIN